MRNATVSARSLLAASALAFAAMLTAGCNTMAGVGKDVQSGGEKIENSAEKNNR